jgi:membrane-associated protease RseP (regulator of RpoE activity)
MDITDYGVRNMPMPAADPLQAVIDSLRGELVGLFQVRHVDVRRHSQIISFTGRLLNDADMSYQEIEQRFRPHGYTPMLRREKGEDVLLALEGIIEQARTGNPLMNLLLFVITVFTTLAAGATLSNENLVAAVLARSPLEAMRAAAAGAPFAITLLGILGVHEFGHYIAARWHGVAATLPYFIPMPFNTLGTMGAFIAVKSPMQDRRVLFDIGISGPLAGLVVALPMLVVGLLLSNTHQPFYYNGLTLRLLGNSLLVQGVVDFFKDIPAGNTLVLHPVFYAAWWGLLITGINLLPVGQLDGGHVAYALFGRRAHLLAQLTFVGLLLAGYLLSRSWFVWAFLIMLGGLRHPAPMNDITGLGPVRNGIGAMAAVLFVLIITPVPFNLGF